MAILEGRISVAEISRHLGVSRATLFRLRDLEPNARLVRAIKLQLGLRQVIAAAPTGSFVAEGFG